MKKSNVVLLILLIVLIITGVFAYFIISANKEKADNIKIAKPKKVIYEMPNIPGNEHIITNEFGGRTNNSEELKKTKIYNGFEFRNFKIYSKDGKSNIIFEIYNPKDKTLEVGEYQLQFMNDKDEIIAIMDCSEAFLLDKGTSKVFLEANGDPTNIKDIKVDNNTYEMLK